MGKKRKIDKGKRSSKMLLFLKNNCQIIAKNVKLWYNL